MRGLQSIGIFRYCCDWCKGRTFLRGEQNFAENFSTLNAHCFARTGQRTCRKGPQFTLSPATRSPRLTSRNPGDRPERNGPRRQVSRSIFSCRFPDTLSQPGSAATDLRHRYLKLLHYRPVYIAVSLSPGSGATGLRRRPLRPGSITLPPPQSQETTPANSSRNFTRTSFRRDFRTRLRPNSRSYKPHKRHARRLGRRRCRFDHLAVISAIARNKSRALAISR